MKPMRMVMIYVEPTPYIIALIDTLRRVWGGSIEVYYITTDLSQPWELRLESGMGMPGCCPGDFLPQMQALWLELTRDRKHTILHLAGWGHSVLLGALLMARSLGIPVAVESDTAEGRSDPFLAALGEKVVLSAPIPVAEPFSSGRYPTGPLSGAFRREAGAYDGRANDGRRLRHPSLLRKGPGGCAIRRARALGMSADERIVLYIGRLEVYKGLQELLSAFARAMDGESDLRLAIAGDGSLRPRIEAIAANADCHITYLGRLSGDDVLRAYLAADLLVLPSLFEPWGLVVNEAMACGLPVIVSDRVGCADDLVRHGQTGLVVSAGREIALTDALQQLVRDAPARSRMRHAAESLISNWTLGNEAQNVVCAWREIAQ